MSEEKRSVGIGLIIGLVIVPYLCVWFLFRKGHSRSARIIGVIWTAIFMFSFMSAQRQRADQAQTHQVNPPPSVIKQAPIAKPAEYWTIDQYIDAFKNKTDKKFMINSESFVGTFSNTATTDDVLYVDLLFNSQTDVKIMLYKWNKKTCVKSNSDEKYLISILGSNTGKKIDLTGTLSGDRISLDDCFGKFHEIIKSNNLIKVSLVEIEHTTSSYYFQFIGGRQYESAISKL